MSWLVIRRSVVCLAAIVSLMPLMAADDAAVEPLPPSAVARIGSTRFYDGGSLGPLAISADNRLLAVAPTGDSDEMEYRLSVSPEPQITLWDLATGQWQRRIVDKVRSFNALAFSPKGDKLLTTDGERLIVYDVATGKKLCEPEANRGTVTAIAWTPDGSRFVSAGPTALVEVWDAKTGQRAARLHKRAAQIAVLPDGARVALLSVRTDKLWIWDMVDDHAAIETRCEEALPALAIMPDGKRVAVVTHKGIALYHAKTALPLPAILLKPIYPQLTSLDSVTSLCFLGDGRRVAMTARDTLGLFDVEGFDKLAEGDDAHLVVADHLRGTPSGYPPALSPDGTLAISRRSDGWTAIDVKATRERTVAATGAPAPLCALALSPDGRWLLTVDRRPLPPQLRIWNVAERRVERVLDALPAAAADKTKSRLEQARDKLRLEQERADRDERPTIWTRNWPDSRSIAARSAEHYPPRMRFSPDGQFVVGITSRDGPLYIWRIRDGRLMHSVPMRDVLDFDFADEGKTLAVVDDANGLALWDVAAGERQGHVTLPEALRRRHVWSLCFGSEIVGMSMESSGLAFCDAISGKVLWSLAKDDRIAAVSLDRSRLVVMESRRSYVVRDVRSGEVLERLTTQGYVPRGSAALSSKGSRLAIVNDRRISLWDLETDSQLGEFGGHSGPIDFCAFTPDDRLLITGGQDGTVVSWDLQRVLRGEK